jgi:DNA-binding SARP family transcriptional activator
MFGWETGGSGVTLCRRGHPGRARPGKDAAVDKTLTPHTDGRTRLRGELRARPGEPPWAAVFEALPLAALVLGPDARVTARNPAAAALLGPLAESGARCCELLGCRLPGGGLADGCATRLAQARGGLPEVQVQLEDGSLAWLAAMPAGPGGDVVVTLRPPGGRADVPAGGPAVLRLLTLGRTRVEVGGAPLQADWLAHRPGLVLKYLASERGRVVTLEELLEVIWPAAGRAGAANVRQAVHTLRDRLEPRRTRGLPSSFVLGRRGGYELAPDRVWIDADDFEARARAGLQALAGGSADRAEATLAAALATYGGDFLADEPYAEWALPERERLRELAAQVLRALGDLGRAAGDVDGAAGYLQRLADLEPLDLGAQRELIALMLQRGRHSEALRRYELVRRRYKRAFGEEPGFALVDLTGRR